MKNKKEHTILSETTPLSFGEALERLSANRRIRSILIANRGEISLRIQRTSKKMGIKTVAVYNDADQHSAFVKNADEAVFLDGSQLADTYLNIDKIINAALKTGCDAIHPGYGFLSENTSFVKACEKAGIIFIGPGVSAMDAMGNKISARATAVKAGVPITPGITGSAAELLKNYKTIEFPILIKAAAGGGGKGMRVVNSESEFQNALEATAREAKSYFGDDTVYIEKYINKPRHIEVQILGDQHGNVVHLYERECSLQRRHQKIIEEAPAITLSQKVRDKICNAAVALAKSIGYYSAGTMEFLVDESQQFYFLEMNTRIQVEHPVTELTTGMDIVEQQINIANGSPLSVQQKDIQQNGHAIECRIYAEDPKQHFLPSPGLLAYYEEPVAESNPLFEVSSSRSSLFEASSPRTDMLSPQATIRIDGMQLQTGDMISGDFDPMISKLIVWNEDREKARQSMLSALEQYPIKGIKTNLEFLTGLMLHPDYINNHISTKYIDTNLEQIIQFIQTKKQETDQLVILAAALAKSLEPDPNQKDKNIWQTLGYWRHSKNLEIVVNEKSYQVELLKNNYPNLTFAFEKNVFEVTIIRKQNIGYELVLNGEQHQLSVYETKPGAYEISHSGLNHSALRADISFVDAETFTSTSGSSAGSGNITSPMPGKVIKVNVAAGDEVKKGDVLLIVEAMKMENNIISIADAIVKEIKVKEGDKVDTSNVLVSLSLVEKS